MHVDCVPHVATYVLNFTTTNIFFLRPLGILRQHTFLYIYVIILLSKFCLVLPETIFISEFFLA